MIIRIDPGHREPPYRQIREQVVAAVASGELAPETRLPTIRQLAVDLDLAAGTVARAYRELEVDGFIQTRGRKGTFVVGASRPPVDVARRRQVDRVVEAAVAEARRLGAPPGEIATALARALTAGP